MDFNRLKIATKPNAQHAWAKHIAAIKSRVGRRQRLSRQHDFALALLVCA